MTGPGKWCCPHCAGVVRAGRGGDLPMAITVHEESCPSTLKVRRS